MRYVDFGTGLRAIPYRERLEMGRFLLAVEDGRFYPLKSCIRKKTYNFCSGDPDQYVGYSSWASG